MSEIPLYRSKQVQEIDRRALQKLAVPGYALMTHAASAAWRELRAQWPRARRMLVLCGAGNNGGDGYVLARLAHEAGLAVEVGYLSDPAQLQGDALTAGTDARAAGVSIRPFSATALENVDLIVDALLGTGLQRALDGAWAAAVDAVNASRLPVLALDIPSGLDADSGAIRGCAVRAALTVTFIAAKPGLYTGEGPACVGRLLRAPLDVPPALYADVDPAAWLLDSQALPNLLPGPRPRSAHKGQFGHVLVVGGQPGMSGAAQLAAEAAARVGAGLVTVATHPSHAAILNARRPELMCIGVETGADLLPLLARATVVVIGPGLGRDRWGQRLLAAVLDSRLPLVVDADALNLLADEPARRVNWILTPHPGEAARLLHVGVADVQANRLQACAEVQAAFAGVCVLKGAGTLIQDDGRCRISPSGNPGMASGGMGDVLTGVIAGLVAQRVALTDAALAGVMLHGLAGDDAAAAGGERGLLASDLLPALRRRMNPPT